MLNIDNTVLLVIDIQEKLHSVIYQKENLTDNVLKLVQGANVLELPIILTEQYPKGLGGTIPEVMQSLAGVCPIEKTEFSCCANENFKNVLSSLGRKQVLVCGIECHICVYQTALALKEAGYEVQAVADAVSSRTPENKEIGINLMRQKGITITGTETALFELLKVAGGEKFKAISRIVK
ncbi:MAG: hydrolase [Dehalococcoidales bacterium]